MAATWHGWLDTLSSPTLVFLHNGPPKGGKQAGVLHRSKFLEARMGRKSLVISLSEMPQKKVQEEENKGEEVRVLAEPGPVAQLC